MAPVHVAIAEVLFNAVLSRIFVIVVLIFVFVIIVAFFALLAATIELESWSD